MRCRIDQRGVALVLVLWVLVLLTTMAISMSTTQRLELNMAANLTQERQARALVDAGIEFMALQLLLQRTGPEEEKWKADGMARPWRFNDRTVYVAATPENGRIDVNVATPEMLEELLRSVGLEDAQAAQIRDAILDWRDADDQRQLNGAEDPQYEDAGRPYGAKDAAFASVEELRMVLGITPAIFDAIASALTVHSRRRTVNPLFASRQVLSAMPGMDETAVDDYIALRTQNQAQGLAVPAPTGVNRMYLEMGKTPIFRVYAETEMPEGGMVKGEVVLNIASRGRGGLSYIERSYAPRATPGRAPLDTEE